jgi:phage terminase large subunit-like protein
MIGARTALAIVVALRKVESPDERERLLRTMALGELLLLDACFEAWAHEGQRPPEEPHWRTWAVIAGRGFGKTRAGAEWITGLATQRGRKVRIALVSATDAEVRSVMVEGESGLLAVARAAGIRPPCWEPSLGRLTWPNGSVAQIFSGENPERLRGFNHHYAWCDELAKWARPEATWANLQMSLRSGPRPRVLVTTTPRPIPLLKRILAEPWTVATRGRTADNVSLDEGSVRILAATYGGTRLGRQELDGELIEDVDGSLWPRALIERCRLRPPFPWLAEPKFLRRVVVGVDPPASSGGDACGIVVCGRGADGLFYVLEDASVGGATPEAWAAAAVRAATRWDASRIVAEGNQGGEMVASVLRRAGARLPIRMATARRGKSARAEPVAFLFERGEARLAGAFPALEDELAGLTIGGSYQGPGRSPDRADACVWAMTELAEQDRRPDARVTRL